MRFIIIIIGITFTYYHFQQIFSFHKQIKYRPSFKPYQLDFTPSTFTRLPVSSPNIYRRVLLGLEPGTQYEIEVSAETSIGQGDPVSIAGFTKPKTGLKSIQLSIQITGKS